MKRIKKRLVAIVALCLTATLVFAQGGHTVKGVVSDEMGPVVGASIFEKGNATNGTTTDFDGRFTLSVQNPNATLVFSYIGLQTKEVALNGKTTLTVTLQEDAELLEDVIVIGYGTVKKNDATGSVMSVEADQLNKGIATSPTTLLQGKSAGVVVTAAPAG